MHQPSTLASAACAAKTPAPDAPRTLLTRGPPAASGDMTVTRPLPQDHARIVQDVNDVVVHRIFAAGLDLQAALGMIGDQPETDRIYHAIGELDQAIRCIRDTIFDRDPPDPRSSPPWERSLAR